MAALGGDAAYYLFGNAKTVLKVRVSQVACLSMSRERREGEYSSREKILRRIRSDGYDPAGFAFYFVSEQSADGKIDCCHLEDLPEELDSFCCQGEKGQPLYNYDRHKNPNIVKLERPEPEEC